MKFYFDNNKISEGILGYTILISNYERNVLDQPKVWKKLLETKLPSKFSSSVLSSARISEFLWRDYAHVDGGKDPISFQSFDFVKIPNLYLHQEDLVIVFSHRGTKTFSMQALEIATINTMPFCGIVEENLELLLSILRAQDSNL